MPINKNLTKHLKLNYLEKISNFVDNIINDNLFLPYLLGPWQKCFEKTNSIP